MGNSARITGKVEGDLTSSLAGAGLSANHIIVGDTNHADQGVRNVLASREMMQGLAESGVAHVCLEIPSYLQDYADQYRSGDMSYDEFRQVMQENIILQNEGEVDEESFIRSAANTIAHASQFGIDVHFVDPGLPMPPEEAAQAMGRVLLDYETSTGNEIDFSDADSMRGALTYMLDNELIAPDDMEILKVYGGEFMNERLNDQALYDNIMAATNGEKTAIIYGAAHDHLGELLGDNVMVFDIYEDGKTFYDHQDNDGQATIEGEPDFVYVIRDDSVYATDQASEAQKQAVNIDEGAAPANGYFLGVLPIDPPSSNNIPVPGQ